MPEPWWCVVVTVGIILGWIFLGIFITAALTVLVILIDGMLRWYFNERD